MAKDIKTRKRYTIKSKGTDERAAQPSGSFDTELKTKSDISDIAPKTRPDVVLKTADTFNKAGKAAEKVSEGLKDAGHMIEDITDDTGAGSNSYAGNKVSAISSRAGSGVLKYAKRTYNKSMQNTKRTLHKIKQGKFTPKGRNLGKGAIKNTKKSIKKTKKGIKTAQNTAKTSVKTTKASVKYAKKMYAYSKQGVKAVWKVTKISAVTIKKIIEALIALIKGLITILGTAGIVIIIILIIVAIILLIINSPFGIFMGDDGEEDTPTIQEVIIDLDQQFNDKIVRTINEAGELHEVIIDIQTADETYRVPNWNDVLSIFAVKLSLDETDPTDVFIMTKDKVEVLKEIFWEMNVIYSSVSEEIVATPTPTPSPYPTPIPTPTPYPTPTISPSPTPYIERTLIITLDSKTYIQGIKMYDFTMEQKEFIEELRSAEYYTLFLELCGIDTFNGLTPEQELDLLNSLPNTTGGEIVRNAISRLGNPYSQAYRGIDNYVDCSYLARWCYNQAGITSFKAGTAAAQAQYCDRNGYNVSYYDLQYGDLIFWSFKENGRYKDITHVGIYAGNGMVIDASSSRGMVVYRELFGRGSIVTIGRPR